MRNRKKFTSVMAGIMAAVLLLSLILSMIPVARAASSGEIRDQINDMKARQSMIRQEMNDLREQYRQNENEIVDLVERKLLIDQEVFLLEAEIALINEQISAFALLIADKQDELDEAQGRFRDLNAEHRERIRIMEEEGSMSYWEVIFRASSFADLIDRLNMIQEIAAADHRRLEELTAAADQVELAKEELEREAADLETTRKELDASNAELIEKKQVAEATLAELIEKAAEIEAMYGDIESEEAALLTEIARKEKEYNEAKHQEWLEHMATATTETTAPATNPTTAPTETTRPGSTEETEPTKQTEPPATTEPPKETEPPETTEPASEGWIVPCSYTKLTSPFGEREAPTEGASTFHQGVDLAGPEGTPIYAARSGTVTIATSSRSAGFYVTINHGDGFSSVYMHMTHFVVSVGQKVSRGELIGYMGSTGISTGSHLHFGIAYNGVYVNPVIYVPLY